MDEGTRSLTWLRPIGSDVDAEVKEIKAALDYEKELGSGVAVLDMFQGAIDRRRTILSVCAVSLQAGSGSMFIIGKSFSPAALSLTTPVI